MRREKWNAVFGIDVDWPPASIAGINRLPEEVKQRIYAHFIPQELLTRFDIPPDFRDAQGQPLLSLVCPPGSSVMELSLFHAFGFPDPILYGQITDTLTGRLHVMLYVVNDPEAPRFDVDRMPDGSPTRFGILQRNIPAEIAALQAGLAPGQIRRGLRLLTNIIETFDTFVTLLGHERFYAEPLYYHNAVLLEKHGFAYQAGRKRMEEIERGFAPDGVLTARLDGSTPFRMPHAVEHIRLRSWAIHDGLLGEMFTNVTMYRVVGKDAGVRTTGDINW